MSDDRPLTVQMVATRWACSPAHVRALVRRGELRTFRLGGKLIRIPADAVLEVEQCEKRSEEKSNRIDPAMLRIIARRKSE